MDKRSSPQISSFVLRFVQDEPAKPADMLAFRGSIRHIQSDQELAFTRWIDALNFMEQFVPGEVFHLTDPSTQLSTGCKEPE
jgi:hypothetical protein